MIGAFSCLISHYSNPRALLLALACIYLIVSLLAMFHMRWAVGTCVLVAFVLMIRWLPMVSVNIWMFFSGHELYQDSPATILIVLIYAIVFAVPATLLCILYLANRKKLWQIIRFGTAQSNA